MIFQNLTRELKKDILLSEESDHIKVLLETVILKAKKDHLNKLWAIETIKFTVNITKDIIKVMFNSEAEVNILLYLITLTLSLAICLNMTVTIKDISDKQSYIIKYISKVFICINNVTI